MTRTATLAALALALATGLTGCEGGEYEIMVCRASEIDAYMYCPEKILGHALGLEELYRDEWRLIDVEKHWPDSPKVRYYLERRRAPLREYIERERAKRQQ